MKYLPLVAMLSVLCVCRKPANPDSVPPGLELATSAPQWVQNYHLVLPNSAIYQSAGRYVYKSFEAQQTIEGFYNTRLTSLGFEKVISMNQNNVRLLQFQRKTEIISVEISKLPYGKSNLIRLGHSKVKMPQ